MTHIAQARTVFDIEIAALKTVRAQLDSAFDRAVELIVATLNRTLKALALAKIGAEYVLRWLPQGTHDWSRFVEPQRLRAILEESGLKILKTQGVSFDPLNWNWRLSADTDVNYMVVAGKP